MMPNDAESILIAYERYDNARRDLKQSTVPERTKAIANLTYARLALSELIAAWYNVIGKGK
jgi:hypothetical protein